MFRKLAAAAALAVLASVVMIAPASAVHDCAPLPIGGSAPVYDYHGQTTAQTHDFRSGYPYPGQLCLDAKAGGDFIYDRDTHSKHYGGGGGDFISGYENEDYLIGDDGDDIIFGGSGDDDLWGSANDDAIRGEQGNDLIVGGAHNDTLYANSYQGGEGADSIYDGEGYDVIYGGTTDHFFPCNDGVADSVANFEGTIQQQQSANCNGPAVSYPH